MTTYQYFDHKVYCENGNVSCETCSIPELIAKSILFMHENNIRTLEVNGSPIKLCNGFRY